MKVFFALVLLASCSGRNDSTPALSMPKVDTTISEDGSYQLSISPDEVSGNISWTIQEYSHGKVQGECEFEILDINDQQTVSFKNNEISPFCSGIQIDPTSTVQNIVLTTNSSKIEFCMNSNQLENCGSITK